MPAPTDKIVVKSGNFDPPSAVVTAGMQVTWNNQDSVAYLIADNNQSFAFNLPANGSFSLTFTDPGTYNYHCTVHPYMQGTIIVASGAVSNSSNETPVAIDELISKVRPSVVAVDAENNAQRYLGTSCPPGTVWDRVDSGQIRPYCDQ